MSKLFVISGRISSGKSTVARGLAEGLRWKLGGFGDFVRYEANRRGLRPLSRAILQDLGQELVSSSVQGFCRDYLAFIGFRPGQNLILDGMRHPEVLAAINLEARASFSRLLSITAQVQVRKTRFSKQEPAEHFDAADNHPVEVGNDLLASTANFRLDTSTLSPAVAQLEALNWAVETLR